MVLNGTIGARLHVPFPVLNRSSFGFWLSYFSVISRVILSTFWFAIQSVFHYLLRSCLFKPSIGRTYTGAECVYQVRCSRVLMTLVAFLLYIIIDVESDMAFAGSPTQ